jgi:hypothetical protein
MSAILYEDRDFQLSGRAIVFLGYLERLCFCSLLSDSAEPIGVFFEIWGSVD